MFKKKKDTKRYIERQGMKILSDITCSKSTMDGYKKIITDLMKDHESNMDEVIKSFEEVIKRDYDTEDAIAKPVSQTLVIYVLNESKNNMEKGWESYIR